MITGLVVSVVVSGGALLILGWLGRRSSAGGGRKGGGIVNGGGWEWIDGIALALGYGAGHIALRGWPSFPPHESVNWLAYLAVLSLIAAWADRSPRSPVWVRWGARGLLGLVFAWALTGSFAWNRWSLMGTVGGFVGIGSAFVVSWVLLEAFEERMGAMEGGREWVDRWVLWLLVISVGGGAVVLGLSDSPVPARLGGVAAGALGAEAVVLLFRPRQGSLRTIFPVILVIALGPWVDGVFHGRLAWGTALFLLLSPHGGWFAILRKGKAKSETIGRRRAVAFAGVMFCLIGAVLVTYYTSRPFG